MDELIKMVERHQHDPRFQAFIQAGGDADAGYDYLIFLNVMEKRYLEQYACTKCICRVHQNMRPRNSDAFSAFVLHEVEKGFQVKRWENSLLMTTNPSLYHFSA